MGIMETEQRDAEDNRLGLRVLQSLKKMRISSSYMAGASTWLAVAYSGILWLSAGAPIAFGLLPLILAIRAVLSFIGGRLDAGQFGLTGQLQGERKLENRIGDTLLILPFVMVEPFSMPWILAILGLVWLAECSIAPGTVDNKLKRPGPMNMSGCKAVFGLLGVMVWNIPNLSPVFYWSQPLICISAAVTLIRSWRVAVAQY